MTSQNNEDCCLLMNKKDCLLVVQNHNKHKKNVLVYFLSELSLETKRLFDNNIRILNHCFTGWSMFQMGDLIIQTYFYLEK